MKKSFARIAILITVITLVSKIFGFFREVIFAAKFGATFKSDAFLMAQSIVEVMTGIILAALGTTFTPIMSEYIIKKSKQETNEFLNVIITISTTIAILICVIGMIFAEKIVMFFAPGFSTKSVLLTVDLTRILLPSIVLSVIITMHSGILKNHERYLITSAIAFPMNLTLIITILTLTDLGNIKVLAFAFLIGTLLQVLFQYPFLQKFGYKFKFNFDIKEEGLRKIGVLMIPILFGSSLLQINTMVDKILASGLAEGSVAALNFSHFINVFIIGILLATVTSIYYTSMSNYYSQGRVVEFKQLLKTTINILTIIVVPASIGFCVLRYPVVQIIFQRGSFDREASEKTALALYYFTPGLIGFAVRDVISRAFYSIKDTKTAMLNGSIAVLINIILSTQLVKFLGLGGIALATSVSGIIGTALLMISLHKKIGDYGIESILITFTKVLIASAIMGIIINYSFKMIFDLFSSNLISVLISIIIGGMVYGLLVYLLKVDEVNEIRRIIQEKLK
jgi:putative peptidoglycan lipid II flippase